MKLLCFSTFGFFSKCTFLRLQHFICPSTYPINSIFSVVVCIYKIRVFDEVFFLLAIVAMITEKMYFSYLHGNLLLGKNLFIKSCSLSIHTILENNGIRWIRSTAEKLSQSCTLQPITKVKGPSKRVKKHQKKIFFNFYYHLLSCSSKNLICCLMCLIFCKSY